MWLDGQLATYLHLHIHTVTQVYMYVITKQKAATEHETTAAAVKLEQQQQSKRINGGVHFQVGRRDPMSSGRIWHCLWPRGQDPTSCNGCAQQRQATGANGDLWKGSGSGQVRAGMWTSPQALVAAAAGKQVNPNKTDNILLLGCSGQYIF